MLILLDCRPLASAGAGSEKTRLILSVATVLSRDRDIGWLLVSGPGDPVPELPGAMVVTRRVFPGRLGWRLWYDVQIPRLAGKHRVNGVMTTGGIAARVRLPQCLWMPERPDPRGGGGYPPVYAARLAESLGRAGVLIGYSGMDRDWLVQKDRSVAERLALLRPSPAESAGPLSAAARGEVRAEFAQGREYFFADARHAGEEGIIHLLKAYSLFKKRQLSNLPLVIMGEESAGVKVKLETYKYREGVSWCDPAPDKVRRLMGGAYAGLFLFEGLSLGGPLLDAWKAGVPVVVASGGRFQEWAGEAALVAAPGDPASLAAQLMSVYKDEDLRGRLIARGLSRVAEFGVEHGKSLESVKLRLAKLYYDNLFH